MGPGDSIFQKLEQLFDGGKYDELTLALMEAFNDNPSDPNAYYWKGRLAEHNNDFGTAINCLEKAVHFSPQTVLFYATLAQSLDRKQAYELLFNPGDRNPKIIEKITALWQKVMELAPGEPIYKALFADFLAGQKRLQDAFPLIKEAFSLAPTEEQVKVVWLRINLKIGCILATENPVNPETGLKHLSVVLKEIPHHPDANLFAGVCYRRLKKYDEAQKHLEACLPKIRKENNAFLFMPFFELASLHLERGDIPKAREILTSGLSMDPQNGALRDLLDRLESPETARNSLPTPGRPEGNPSTQAIISPSLLKDCLYPTTEKQILSIINVFSTDVQSIFRDIGRELNKEGEGNFTPLLKKYNGFNLATTLTSEKEQIALVRVFFLFVQEGLASSRDFSFSRYFTFLPEFVRIYGILGIHPDVRDYGRFLCEWTDQFLPAFFPAREKVLAIPESLLGVHLQNLNEFFSSAVFPTWASFDGSPEFLEGLADRWMEHLANLVKNRRGTLFTSLLDSCLTLLKNAPSLREHCQGLPPLLVCAKSGFEILDGEKALHIRTILEKHKEKASGEMKPFLQELHQAFVTISLESIQPVREPQETRELTVEYAYQAALEEILGDGKITEEENAILQNLRDYLNIPPQIYQKIFHEVDQKRKSQRLPALNRDFSPDEFLYRILSKTIEDGKITEEEKGIIKNLCQALLKDKVDVEKAFQRAKEMKSAGNEPVATLKPGRRSPLADKLAAQLRDEKKLGNLFSTAQGQEALNKVRQIQANLSKDPESRDAFFSGFLYQPAVYPFPVMSVFALGHAIDPLRLAFKGGLLDALFTCDVRANRDGAGQKGTSPALVLQNRCLDSEIPLHCPSPTESSGNLIEGLKERQGQYVIALCHFPTMIPFQIIHQKGSIELSGKLKAGMDFIGKVKFEQALSTLHSLRKETPNIFDISYTIGFCHKSMAQKGIDPVQNYQLALKYYQEELTLNPRSDKVLNSIGVVYKQLEKWNEAAHWLSQALQFAPFSIPVLATLVTTLYNRDVIADTAFKDPPDYLIEYLGRAYHFCPEHPITRQLVEKFSGVFNTDLRRVFRVLRIDSSFE